MLFASHSPHVYRMSSLSFMKNHQVYMWIAQQHRGRGKGKKHFSIFLHVFHIFSCASASVLLGFLYLQPSDETQHGVHWWALCCLFFFSSALNYKAWMADHCYVRKQCAGFRYQEDAPCNFLTCVESCTSVGEDLLFQAFVFKFVVAPCVLTCCLWGSYLLPLGFLLVACCLWGSYLVPITGFLLNT